jgi:hypothetical protein
VACTSSSGGYYTLDHGAPIVNNPAAGRTYQGSAWVRSSSSVGQNAAIVLQQLGGTQPDSEVSGAAVSLSTSWQQVSATLVIGPPDRTGVGVHIVQYDASAGDSFNVDDIVVIEQ